MNITLDPDTSGATWTDEGYGGEASTYLLYDGGILAVAVDSIDPLLRRRLLFTDDYDRRELKGGKDKNRTRGGGGGGGGKNRDGSERTWNSKRGWRRRNAKTLSYALEENVACYSTVVLTVVAENAAGASEPSEPFERTLNGCWRDPTHVPTTAQPSPSPTPVPTLSPAPSTATPSAKPTTAQPTLSSDSTSSGSDGAVFVVVAAVIGAVSAILLACFGFVWRKKRSARVAPMGEAPAPAPAPARRARAGLWHTLADTTDFELHTPEAPAPPAPVLATVTPEAPAQPAPRTASRFWLAWRSARAFTRPAPVAPAQPQPEAAPPPARETASRIWLAWRRARARNADEVFAEIARLLRRPASVHPTTPSGP